MTNTHNLTYESIFQADIIAQMQAQDWQLGRHQPSTALYETDVLAFTKTY